MASSIGSLYEKFPLSRRFRVGWFLLLLVYFLIIGLFDRVGAALVNRKISGSLTSDGDVSLFKISPDGSYVVFVADARFDGIPELFSVPIGGGPRNSLTPPIELGTAVLGFAIAPDSQRVVYWTGPVIGSANKLFAVPISGGEWVDLAGNLGPITSLSDVKIAPDSLHVVYLIACRQWGCIPSALAATMSCWPGMDGENSPSHLTDKR